MALTAQLYGSGTWVGKINDTLNDACANMSYDARSNLTCNSDVVCRFIDVRVPKNAVLRNASLNIAWLNGGLGFVNYAIEDVDSSFPLPAAWVGSYWPKITQSVVFYGPIFPTPNYIFERIFARYWWAPGNNLSLAVTSPGTLFYLYPTRTELTINYELAGFVNLLGPFPLVPVTGTWSSGLDVGSLNANLSVGFST